jgi:predicted esterase
MRVLGLHGYHGNADTLRRQLSAFDAVADLVCVDAPALADGDFGWWHAIDGADGAVRYRGWTRTRAALSAFCAAHGPFDGVLGFSQGAAVAAVLVALAVDAEAQRPFAILIGGFASRDPRHAAVLDRIDVPSLHIIGRSDSVVSPQTSRALASRFRAPTIVEHADGHVIPATASVCEAAHQFLHAMAQRAVISPVRRTPDRARD